MAKKILIVDDSMSLAEMIEKVLVGQGYEVFIASDGREALRVMYAQKPDLILLDVAMPGMDGWQTCTRIREMSDVPIIMLTGTQKSEEDIARGIDMGADDYLIKPIGNVELTAKIRAVLRRAELPYPVERDEIDYRDDVLSVDIPGRNVSVNGERVRLTPTEFRLLSCLVEKDGHVVTYEELLKEVWGKDQF